MTFDPQLLLPDDVLAKITDVRVSDPDRVCRAARARRRRTKLTEDGRLNIVAADHPARGVTRASGDASAMADRGGFLARIIRVLQVADGVMATMDVIEDLLILDDLLREAGHRALTDDKLLVASFNRGGIANCAWELDDPMTGPDAEQCANLGLDGGKILMRVNLQERDSLRTLEASASAVTDLARVGLPAFLEPLPVHQVDGAWKVDLRAEALAHLIGIAQALGHSSRHTWLKLPYCDPFGPVARSSTLPILILGGESAGDPEPLCRQVSAALAAGPSVRGTLVGRNVLYPGDDDPLVAATMFHALVHERSSPNAAIAAGVSARGTNMPALSAILGR